MNKSNVNNNDFSDITDKIERGLRIKAIREKELKMNKSQLAREIGISSQFLGLIEEGKGNLVCKSLKKLMNVSAHSSDYILFGDTTNSSISNRIIKILDQLPPEANNMIYDLVSSLKDLYEHK